MKTDQVRIVRLVIRGDLKWKKMKEELRVSISDRRRAKVEELRIVNLGAVVDLGAVVGPGFFSP